MSKDGTTQFRVQLDKQVLTDIRHAAISEGIPDRPGCILAWSARRYANLIHKRMKRHELDKARAAAFGDTLFTVRTMLGLQQPIFAERLGINLSTLSAIESGAPVNDSVAMDRICDFMARTRQEAVEARSNEK